MSQRASVGIRELRQDLSHYLKRVTRGESLVITQRNRPVALLSPLLDDDDDDGFWAQMIASGELTPATRSLEELNDLPPLKPKDPSDPYPGTRALEEIRREWWEADAEE